MPSAVVLYVVRETLVDQTETLQGRWVEMRSNPCEDFSRDVKNEAERVMLGAMLEISSRGRLCWFLGLEIVLGSLVGLIEHKTGEVG